MKKILKKQLNVMNIQREGLLKSIIQTDENAANYPVVVDGLRRTINDIDYQIENILSRLADAN